MNYVDKFMTLYKKELDGTCGIEDAAHKLWDTIFVDGLIQHRNVDDFFESSSQILTCSEIDLDEFLRIWTLFIQNRLSQWSQEIDHEETSLDEKEDIFPRHIMLKIYEKLPPLTLKELKPTTDSLFWIQCFKHFDREVEDENESMEMIHLMQKIPNLPVPIVRRVLIQLNVNVMEKYTIDNTVWKMRLEKDFNVSQEDRCYKAYKFFQKFPNVRGTWIGPDHQEYYLYYKRYVNIVHCSTDDEIILWRIHSFECQDLQCQVNMGLFFRIFHFGHKVT